LSADGTGSLRLLFQQIPIYGDYTIKKVRHSERETIWEEEMLGNKAKEKELEKQKRRIKRVEKVDS
jgi:hypothetical protein